jgi:hypothetical protein
VWVLLKANNKGGKKGLYKYTIEVKTGIDDALAVTFLTKTGIDDDNNKRAGAPLEMAIAKKVHIVAMYGWREVHFGLFVHVPDLSDVYNGYSQCIHWVQKVYFGLSESIHGE